MDQDISFRPRKVELLIKCGPHTSASSWAYTGIKGDVEPQQQSTVRKNSDMVTDGVSLIQQGQGNYALCEKKLLVGTDVKVGNCRFIQLRRK